CSGTAASRSAAPTSTAATCWATCAPPGSSTSGTRRPTAPSGGSTSRAAVPRSAGRAICRRRIRRSGCAGWSERRPRTRTRRPKDQRMDNHHVPRRRSTMRGWLTGTALAALLSTATPAVAQMPAEPVLQLSFDANGRVTLIAHQVTARDILAEWARQCGCLVVNAARLNSAPLAVPIQFEQAEQSRVLQSLLREAAGYVLTPKRAGSQSASDYETIYILATSNPIAGAYVPPPP